MQHLAANEVPPAYNDATKRNSMDGENDDTRSVRLLPYFPLGVSDAYYVNT
jgi:hypothetical protein